METYERCAFCNRTPDETPVLIAGHAANICAACVMVCVESVIEHELHVAGLPQKLYRITVENELPKASE